MSGPAAGVLVAFGLDPAAPVEPLPGGQGRAWRSGPIVLKPVDDAREHAWVCEVYAGWPAGAGIAVPEPLRAESGGWTAEGWGAYRMVPGEHLRAGDDPARFRDAAERFHAVVATLPRPGLLDDRDDPWSHGDRVAWGEADPTATGPGPVREVLRLALAACRPVDLPSQVVHGDLTTNVLASAAGPAVIDWPPYFRPPGWALAVVAVDSLCWQGAPPSLLDAWSDLERWRDLLLRALVYRLDTRVQQDHAAGDLPEAAVLDLVLAKGD